MTEKSPSELAPVTAAPAYLSKPEYADVNKALDQYVSPSRLKIVQGAAKPPISDLFTPGDLIITPTLDLIVKKGGEFDFVPIFFYPEWATFNPIGVQPTVIDRSLDPTCTIAKLARNPKTRKQPCAEAPGKNIKHQMIFHIIVALRGHPQFDGIPLAMSFRSAELTTGSNFTTKLRLSSSGGQGGDLPMFARTWRAKVSNAGRTNEQGSWFGFDISAIDLPGAWVPENLFAAYGKLWENYKKAYDDNKVVIDIAENTGDETASTDEF